MALTRKQIPGKIARLRFAIDDRSKDQSPSLIGQADRELVEYRQEDVMRLITHMAELAARRPKSADILMETVEYRRQLDGLLDQRLRQLADS
jgi:hypothetical protein